jgi:hypothetical protein
MFQNNHFGAAGLKLPEALCDENFQQCRKLRQCVSQTFPSLWQIPDKNYLKEEKFVLAHGFRGSFHSWLAPLLWARCDAEHHVAKNV